MTREKILDYLNLEGINKGQKFEKSTITWLLWFDIFSILFLFLCHVLLFGLTSSRFNIGFLLLLFCIDILFFVLCSVIQNPVYELFFVVAIPAFMSVKFFWAFYVFGKEEYLESGTPIWTGDHLIVTVFFALLAIYVFCLFCVEYVLLKKNNRKVAEQKNRKLFNLLPFWVYPLSAGLLIIVLESPIFEDSLGLSFVFWLFGCIWLAVALMFVPKAMIALKYNVKSWYIDN